eukprot:scaffold103553_cov20-Tisochrysis_lutea.AAC.1
MKLGGWTPSCCYHMLSCHMLTSAGNLGHSMLLSYESHHTPSSAGISSISSRLGSWLFRIVPPLHTVGPHRGCAQGLLRRLM